MNDPLHIEPGDIPENVTYQWIDREFLDAALDDGWKKVPHTRHSGKYPWLMPSKDGFVEIWNLTLCEKDKAAVKLQHHVVMAKARQNEIDAIDKMKEAVSAFSDVDVMALRKHSSGGQ